MKNVKLATSLGDILLELDDEKAPITVANFLKYVNAGFYDGTIFHRVIKKFMVQGGGFESGMKQKENMEDRIENEAANGLVNDKYTIAMARTSDPHSASSQFFINAVKNSFLDHALAQDGWGYAVFGKVIAGEAIVDAMQDIKTGRKGFHDDVPETDIVLIKAEEYTA